MTRRALSRRGNSVQDAGNASLRKLPIHVIINRELKLIVKYGEENGYSLTIASVQPWLELSVTELNDAVIKGNIRKYRIEKMYPGFWGNVISILGMVIRDFTSSPTCCPTDDCIQDCILITIYKSCTKLLTCGRRVGQKVSPLRYSLGRAVVRSETFHAYARLLSSLKEQVHQGRPVSRMCEMALRGFVACAAEAASGASAFTQTRGGIEECPAYKEVLDSLLSSNVLEHATRLVVLLRTAPMSLSTYGKGHNKPGMTPPAPSSAGQATVQVEAEALEGTMVRLASSIEAALLPLRRFLYAYAGPFLPPPSLQRSPPPPSASSQHSATQAESAPGLACTLPPATLPLLRSARALLSQPCTQYWLGWALANAHLTLTAGAAGARGLPPYMRLVGGGAGGSAATGDGGGGSNSSGAGAETHAVLDREKLGAPPSAPSPPPAEPISQVLVARVSCLLSLASTVWLFQLPSLRTQKRAQPQPLQPPVLRPTAVPQHNLPPQPSQPSCGPALPYRRADVYGLVYDVLSCLVSVVEREVVEGAGGASGASQDRKPQPLFNSRRPCTVVLWLLVGLLGAMRHRAASAHLPGLWRLLVRLLGAEARGGACRLMAAEFGVMGQLLAWQGGRGGAQAEVQAARLHAPGQQAQRAQAARHGEAPAQQRRQPGSEHSALLAGLEAAAMAAPLGEIQAQRGLHHEDDGAFAESGSIGAMASSDRPLIGNSKANAGTCVSTTRCAAGGSISTAAATPPHSSGDSLSAALDAGLVGALDTLLRAAGREQGGSKGQPSVPALRRAGAAVEELLLRPGAWPALLAHGSAGQVASLILTLRKLALLAGRLGHRRLHRPGSWQAEALAGRVWEGDSQGSECSDEDEEDDSSGGSGSSEEEDEDEEEEVSSGEGSVDPVDPVWAAYLAALLEQAAAVLLPPLPPLPPLSDGPVSCSDAVDASATAAAGASATGAAAASCAAGASASGSGVSTARLPLTHRLVLLAHRARQNAGGGAAGLSPCRAVGPAATAPQVTLHPACVPGHGSPAAQQQRLLAMYALEQWLPLLTDAELTFGAWDMSMDEALLAWLLPVARQLLALSKWEREDKPAGEEDVRPGEPGGDGPAQAETTGRRSAGGDDHASAVVDRGNEDLLNAVPKRGGTSDGPSRGAGAPAGCAHVLDGVGMLGARIGLVVLVKGRALTWLEQLMRERGDTAPDASGCAERSGEEGGHNAASAQQPQELRKQPSAMAARRTRLLRAAVDTLEALVAAWPDYAARRLPVVPRGLLSQPVQLTLLQHSSPSGGALASLLQSMSGLRAQGELAARFWAVRREAMRKAQQASYGLQCPVEAQGPGHGTPEGGAPWCAAAVGAADWRAPWAMLLPDPSAAVSLAQAAGVVACDFQRCVELDGRSEEGRTMRRCKRCGAQSYCSGACQLAHWRAGHDKACASWATEAAEAEAAEAH